MDSGKKRSKEIGGNVASSRTKKIVAAWRDEDDEISDEIGVRGRKIKYEPKPNAQYVSRLQEAFHLVHGPTPTWATNFSENKPDQDDDKVILEKEKGYRSLPPHELQFEHCVPLNKETKDEGYIIRAIKFNSMDNTALVAGDSVINLMRVTSGKSHPFLQKFVLPEIQVKDVVWSYTGTDFYITSRKERVNWFAHYNIASSTKPTIIKPNALTRDDRIMKLVADPSKRFLIGLGNSGRIHVFSETTKEYIDTLHMGNNVSDVAFSADGNTLYSFGGDGEIFVWDMNRRECVTSWYNENDAPLQPRCLARCQDFIAYGSESGIVNVYSNSDLEDIAYNLKGKQKRVLMPAPKKAIKNLTTPITSLAMNNQSEILAMASNYKDGAFRLFHLNSMTAFRNDFTNGTNLGRINCLDFSPESGYLAFGNNRGTAFLYRLQHYKAY